MSVYAGALVVVRTDHGNSDNFEVKVGMHQGSTLRPLLLAIAICSSDGGCTQRI